LQQTALSAEYSKCADPVTGPGYFIWNYVYILASEQDGGGIVRFQRWKHLDQMLHLLLTERRICILKARQIGVSWLLCAYALWNALFKPGANVLCFSRRDDEAQELVNRVKIIWRNLPSWLQLPLGSDTSSILTFPTMDSAIRSFPSSGGSGRSYTGSIIIMDEWAFHPDARALYSGVYPTAERGQLVGVSTANGKQNLFYEIYSKAKEGGSSYVPIFIPYYVKPGRDKAWWEQQKRDMPYYLAMQEYPENEEDAFTVSGTCMFDLSVLEHMPIRPPDHHIGIAEVWHSYQEGHRYIAGIDPAFGIEGRDQTCMQIIDVTDPSNCFQAARIGTRIPLDEFAEHAITVLEAYDYPFVACEVQPQGLVVLNHFKKNKYPLHRIYHRTKRQIGWHTGPTNRDLILGHLEIATRTGSLKVHSQETLDEMLGFGYIEEKNRFEGQGVGDDEVMSLAITWFQTIEAHVPFEGKPYSYIDGGPERPLVTMSVIDWRMRDPYKLWEIIVCPEEDCEGGLIPAEHPYIENHKTVCPRCRGAGKMARKKERDASPVNR